MKITKLDDVLVDIDDKPSTMNGQPFTLRLAMKAALGSQLQSDANADAKAKEHCYDLMLAVKAANGELDVEAEDAALIKSRIAQMYAPVIVGQAVKLIENK